LLSSSACVAIVFALQYILLASLSSTTSIAFHSFLTFYNISKGKLARSNSAKSFVYYALYSLGIPLFFLLTCLLLYYYNLITITEQYPGNCWFTHDISAYISFSIPGLRGRLHGAFSTPVLNSALLTGLKFFAITWTFSTPGLKRYTIRSRHRFAEVKSLYFVFL
jgi:hypothetical protein